MTPDEGEVIRIGRRRIPVVSPDDVDLASVFHRDPMEDAEATPVDDRSAVTGRHLPALDGLRACAVGGVVAYHLRLGWASGGYLGVDLFFVLSGFLITSLLVEEWVFTARLKLAAFWARRARRLLPALFSVLVAIAIAVVLIGRFGSPGSIATINLPGLRGDALGTLFYVANWHFIFVHQSYFAQFSGPSPLLHTWSLAIEEQFYLVWPLVVLALVTFLPNAWRKVGLGISLAGAGLSALLMAILFQAGGDPTRVYFGTDTHIFDILAGAAVAMMSAALAQPGRKARWVLHAAGPLCAVALGFYWALAGTGDLLPRSGMFTGGFFVCAVLAAVIVADVRQVHQGPFAHVLSFPPLQWLGRISYGVYLWHWPVIVYATEARTRLHGAVLDVAQVGLTLAFATASFYLIESPIRRGRVPGWPRFAVAPVAAVLTAVAVVVATTPSIAVPAEKVQTTSAVAVGHNSLIPGAGGLIGQVPLHIPAPTREHPLRATVLGDSVAAAAEPGIAAALGTTGEVTVTSAAVDGFGLNRRLGNVKTGTTWTRVVPRAIAGQHTQLVLATWSWDDSCNAAHRPSTDFNVTYDCALQHPAAYTSMLSKAVRLLLGPGGAEGIVFLEFPKSGPVLTRSSVAAAASDVTRAAGQAAWDRIVRTMPARFPGRVMYLPIGASVLLKGSYTTWLPEEGNPSAPRSSWVRVRKVDHVHFCPAGVARYANAVLADLTPILHLGSASPAWSTAPWTITPQYDTPPGSCPDDHP